MFDYPHSSLWIITDYLYKNEVIYVVNFEKKCIIFFSLQCITYIDMLVYLHTFKVLQRAFIYFYHLNKFFVVQLLWLVWLFVTPWTATCQASLPFTNSQSLFIHGVSDAIQPSHPLSSPFPPAFNLSPESGSFQMSQFFASGGQSIGASASASVLPMNIQDWFPLGWTSLNSLQSKGLSRVFSNTIFQSINSSALSFLYGTTLTSIYDYWKNYSFD